MNKNVQQQLVTPDVVTRPKVAQVVGDSVACEILLSLVPGPRRFSEFTIPMSSKTLSAKLKLLEFYGLITRTLHAEVPPRVVYTLTEKGNELLSILQGISQWEETWNK